MLIFFRTIDNLSLHESNGAISINGSAFFGRDAGDLMSNATVAAVVCKSCFLRDNVVKCLSENGIDVAGSFTCFEEISGGLDPDIVVAVEAIPGELLEGCRDTASLAKRFKRWLVMGTSNEDSTYCQLSAVRGDVSGVPLDIGYDDMFHAVCLAARTEAMRVGEMSSSGLSKEMLRLKQAGLDNTQWEMLKLLARGATNKHIARRFRCEEGQVKSSMRRLMAAIQVSNRTEAAVIAARAGL